MKVLIINCQRNGLGIMRSLGAFSDMFIIAADPHRFNFPLFSRYVNKRFVVPSVKDETQFIDRIIEIGMKYALDEKILLIPTNDEYVEIFALNWDKLKQYFKPVFDTDLEILADCLEKNRIYRIAEKLKIPLPATLYSPVSMEEIKKIEYPVIIKPNMKRSVRFSGNKLFRVKVCDDEITLQTYINICEECNSSYVIQKLIPGGDDSLYTVGLFANKGKILSSFTGRKIRQFPPLTGEASYAELVKEETIFNYAKRYVEYTGYTGIAQVEFKKYNNTYHLMEINPRSWSWHSLGLYAGVNLPHSAVSMVGEGKEVCYYQKRFSGTWSYFSEDVISNVIRNRNISLLEAINDTITANVHAVYYWKDPLPFFVYYLHNLPVAVIRSIINRVIHKLRK